MAMNRPDFQRDEWAEKTRELYEKWFAELMVEVEIEEELN